MVGNRIGQGDIIKLNLDPQVGHEQSGYRPVVVVSNRLLIARSHVVLICPITNTARAYVSHVPLDARTETTGAVMCEQLRAVDLSHRPYRLVEQMPRDLLGRVIEIAQGMMDIID